MLPRRELSLCPKFVGSAWIPPRERQRGCNEFLCHCTRNGGRLDQKEARYLEAGGGKKKKGNLKKKKNKPQTLAYITYI